MNLEDAKRELTESLEASRSWQTSTYAWASKYGEALLNITDRYYKLLDELPCDETEIFGDATR